MDCRIRDGDRPKPIKNMRKSTAILSALLLSASATTAWADKFEYSDLTFNTLSDNTCEVCEPEMSESLGGEVLTIPAKAYDNGREYTVTAIGNSAFNGRPDLTRVVLPSTVTRIGRYAFEHSSITKINLPASVTEIGEQCFGYCTKLLSVDLPEHLNAIPQFAFQGAGLTQVSIPDGVTEIGQYAFDMCAALKTMTLPASVTTLGYYAIPGGLTTLVFLGATPPSYITQNSILINNCTLVVPKGSLETYRKHFTWGKFPNIVESEQTSIATVTTDAPAEIIGYCDAEGRLHSTPHPGLNIILYSDGTTAKEFIAR